MECPAITPAALGPQHQLKLFTQAGYLPGLPVLVRVEVRNAQGGRERALWDADADLSADNGMTLSTNRVRLYNGLGSSLVTLSGGGDFTLTATVGRLQASRALVSLANAPVTAVGGTLPGASTTWRGVVQVTNEVTVPAGHSLTLESNTLVLVNGTNTGTAGVDLQINGSIQSLGTEEHPVTLTCAQPAANLRWGQIRHNTAQPSLYRHTSITRGGRAPGEGHTGTAPVIRPTNSRIVFESCNFTDYAELSRSASGFGTPGKVMEANGSDIVFNDCLLARARMGPEVGSTAMLCTNTWIVQMPGPDDADGIYVHTQSGGQQVLFTSCVIADGDDDGIDTLGSTITVEDCIIRDWDNRLEDAKGISVFNGATIVRRSLIVDSTVGIAAKWSGGAPTLVTIDRCTLTGNLTNVWANHKDNAPGPFIDYRITNSVLWGGYPVQSDFSPTNFTIGYCDISQSWPGTGNLQAEPMFVNTAAHDFRLQPFSPGIDTGDPTSPPDPDGSPVDLGCFTFLPPVPRLSQPQQLPPNAFQFLLTAYTNRNYVIEVSTHLPAWSALATNFQSSPTLSIQDSARDAERFYRARLAP